MWREMKSLNRSGMDVLPRPSASAIILGFLGLAVDLLLPKCRSFGIEVRECDQDGKADVNGKRWAKPCQGRGHPHLDS